MEKDFRMTTDNSEHSNAVKLK